MARATFRLEAKKLDTEVFQKYYDLLWSQALDGNLTKTARLLGITWITADRWSRGSFPPRSQYYWTIVLEHAIREVIQSMERSSNRKAQKKSRTLLKAFSLIRERDAEYIEYNAYRNSGARRQVLSWFRTRDEVYSSELSQPGLSGGMAKRTLMRAAKDLELDMETRGYGDLKETIYRLPE